MAWYTTKGAFTYPQTKNFVEKFYDNATTPLQLDTLAYKARITFSTHTSGGLLCGRLRRNM